ncbi:MAG TPA: glycosyltransferase [Steroidobacteraceae bacterium]|nr:glycosyltransferase [Steroidobacteraceae bacterium]
MKVLHTIDSLGIYGAETVLLNLAEAQREQGHSPVVLSIGAPGCAPKAIEAAAAARGIECIPFRMRDGLNLKGAADLLRAAGAQRIDAIHSHGYKTNILLGLVGKPHGAPPVVTTLHGWTAKGTFSKLGLYRFLDQRLLRRHDAVVLVNDDMKKLGAIRALPPNKVFSIPNGIALEAAQARADDAIAARLREFHGAGSVLVGGVGRLSPEKNFGALIEALARLPAALRHVKLALLGTGAQEAQLRELVAARGLTDRVWLAGYVANARAYLPQLDILAIPSLTEGLPMILLEAMAAEVPTVSTAVGAIPNTLAGCGALVPAGDVDALSAAIADYARDLPAARAQAAAARQRVHEHFSASTMATRYLEVYEAARRR